MDFSSLNDEQKNAVTHEQGPLLIVAGAGTGKTTVLTQRVAWLIEKKFARSDEILAMTFTEKAAGEMEERLDRALPYGYTDLWAHTFHSFCQRILESHGIEIGLPVNFTIFDETRQWILVHNNFEAFSLDYYRPLGNPTKFIHALLKHFSRLKDEAITPKEYLRYAEDLWLNSDSAQFVSQILSEEERESMNKKEIRELAAQEIKKIQEVADAYHVYQNLLLKNNALDFGDLIHFALRLFSERPKILAQLRAKFKYILVDEFQDTNWAQYELIKILSAPKNNLTVVGDDDQSIYKFRGASVSNILQFKKDFSSAREIFLVKNYRSCQNILDLAYGFIQKNNPNRLEVTLQGEKNFTKKLLAQSSGEAAIEYLELETQEDEMKAVIGKILELKESSKDVTWSDFAILARANSHAEIFNFGLSRAHIPYQYVASRGLYSKPIVLDILAWLKLLDNYHESPALFRILSHGAFGFTQHELMDFNYWAKRKGRSLYQTLFSASALAGIQEATLKKADGILRLIERHTKYVGEKSVREIVLAFLEESGILKHITKIESAESQAALSHLNQFYKKISDFEIAAQDPSIKNFLAVMELELEAGEEGALEPQPELEGPDSVKVMTIHAAKGLEFSYVFIVNLVDRRFPTTERKEAIGIPDALVKEILLAGDIHLEEERRLFYVACSRAKKGLWLTGAKKYGGTRAKKPSIFLRELGIAPKEFFSRRFPEQPHSGAKEKKEFFRMPRRFSFSQLKAYENCPWQYRYAFILKVPVRGKAVFSFGKTIHLVLQKTFERILHAGGSVQKDLFGNTGAESGTQESQKLVREHITLDEILQIYKECFIDDWYLNESQRKDFYKKGKDILKSYYDEIKNEVVRPLFLEKNFSVKILDASRGAEYSLYGVIDRVDEKDGGLHIIDYKTGGGKSELSHDDKEQLLLYQLAAKDIFQKPVRALTFYFLGEGIRQTFLGTEKDLEKIQKKILETVQEIEKGAFAPKPGPLCRYCDFRDICDFKAF